MFVFSFYYLPDIKTNIHNPTAHDNSNKHISKSAVKLPDDYVVLVYPFLLDLDFLPERQVEE